MFIAEVEGIHAKRKTIQGRRLRQEGSLLSRLPPNAPHALISDKAGHLDNRHFRGDKPLGYL